MQDLEFVTECGQSQEAKLKLRNAGSIPLDITIEIHYRTDVFTVTPESCRLARGDITEIVVSFHAPAITQSATYERSVKH